MVDCVKIFLMDRARVERATFTLSRMTGRISPQRSSQGPQRLIPDDHDLAAPRDAAAGAVYVLKLLEVHAVDFFGLIHEKSLSPGRIRVRERAPSRRP